MKLFKGILVFLASLLIGAGTVIFVAPTEPVYGIVSSHSSGGHISTSTHVSTTTQSPAMQSPSARFGGASGGVSSFARSSPSSRFGGSSSINGGFAKSSPTARFGSSTTNKVAPASQSPSMRFDHSYSKGYLNSAKQQAQVNSSLSTRSLNNTAGQMGLNHTKTYEKYFGDPYSRSFYQHNAYNNYYFNAWMFNSHLTTKQHNILVNQGISHRQLQRTSIYRLRVKSANGDDKMVIVTKHQFEQASVGDRIKVSMGNLYVNDKLIKE